MKYIDVFPKVVCIYYVKDVFMVGLILIHPKERSSPDVDPEVQEQIEWFVYKLKDKLLLHCLCGKKGV